MSEIGAKVQLLEIKKEAIQLIDKYSNINQDEEIKNLKNDVARNETANNILREKLEKEQKENKNLNQKLSEKNTVIASLNNQLQTQKMSSKNKNVDR